jgi:hypothetical protein
MSSHLLAWIAIVPLLVGAVLLVWGVGAPVVWIAVITLGIAMVAIDGYQNRQARHQG